VLGDIFRFGELHISRSVFLARCHVDSQALDITSCKCALDSGDVWSSVGRSSADDFKPRPSLVKPIAIDISPYRKLSQVEILYGNVCSRLQSGKLRPNRLRFC